MIRYAEALHILLGAVDGRGLLPIETVPLSSACGRVTASRILSAESLPAFDNSSMDGYAVAASETRRASRSSPVRLFIVGSIAAGDSPLTSSGRGKAVGAYEIMTGAPLPRGFDSVIRLEDVKLSTGGREIEIAAPARHGDFVRCSGYDFKAGMPVTDAGTLLDERHILAFAALGMTRIPVRKKAKVAIISTGKELVDPGKKLRPGQIRNATAAYLLAALAKAGAEAEFYGTAGDDPAGFKRRIKRALRASPDLALTTGAVSMGRHDFVTAAVKEVGAETLFHGVAIRPGKPGLAARFPGGPLFFGMPGNLLSTVVALRFFVVPVLRRLMGQPAERPIRMRLEADASKPEGLRCFFKAKAQVSPAGARIQVLPGQASFRIRPLLQADAWAVLPEAGDGIPAGAEVDVFSIMPESRFFQSDVSLSREIQNGGKIHAAECC